MRVCSPSCVCPEGLMWKSNRSGSSSLALQRAIPRRKQAPRLKWPHACRFFSVAGANTKADLDKLLMCLGLPFRSRSLRRSNLVSAGKGGAGGGSGMALEADAVLISHTRPPIPILAVAIRPRSAIGEYERPLRSAMGCTRWERLLLPCASQRTEGCKATRAKIPMSALPRYGCRMPVMLLPQCDGGWIRC